jgi:hypothetical protein
VYKNGVAEQVQSEKSLSSTWANSSIRRKRV